MVAKG